MSAEITVVRMTAEHLGRVAELERLCFEEPWSERSLELLLSPDAIGVVALFHSRVAAYGGMLWALDEGQITNVAVHPDCRRMGLGHAVLGELLSQARMHDAEQISLEVRESNEAAITLYIRAGFFVAGRRKNFYKKPTEDALVMIKTLRESQIQSN